MASAQNTTRSLRHRVDLAGIVLVLSALSLLVVVFFAAAAWFGGSATMWNGRTGSPISWFVFIAAAPMAVAMLFAARRAFAFRSYRSVLGIAWVAVAFACVGLVIEWATPLMLVGHVAALGLIASAKPAFRS